MPSIGYGDEVEPIPSVKDLASSEPSLRRQSLTAILAHLSTRTPTHPLTPTQCLQLWRGFSVALYMHDSKNAVSVQNLIKTLASTLTTVYEKDLELRQKIQDDDSKGDERQANESSPKQQDESQWVWLSRWTTAFWETISREWSSIDQWRMNKYLLLVRFVVRETFSILSSHLSNNHTNEKDMPSPLASQRDILRAFPLSPRERKVPDGLRLHVLDIWLDELEQISDDDLKVQLMQPVRELGKDAMSKSVRTKAKELVKAFDESGG